MSMSVMDTQRSLWAHTLIQLTTPTALPKQISIWTITSRRHKAHPVCGIITHSLTHSLGCTRAVCKAGNVWFSDVVSTVVSIFPTHPPTTLSTWNLCTWHCLLLDVRQTQCCELYHYYNQPRCCYSWLAHVQIKLTRHPLPAALSIVYMMRMGTASQQRCVCSWHTWSIETIMWIYCGLIPAE
jgi:hypothetical protein